MKVDAIDVFSGDCETDLVNKAVDAGQVVTYGGDAPASKRHTYYGMDNKAAAAFPWMRSRPSTGRPARSPCRR